MFQTKFISIFLSILFSLTFSFPTKASLENEEVVFTVNKYIFKIGGQPFKLDAAPLYDLSSESFLIPLRAFGELLKYSVDWDNNARMATLRKDKKVIEIYVDLNAYSINSKERTTLLKIDKGRILLKDDSISEIFNVSFEVLIPKNEIKFLVPNNEIRIIAKDFTLKDISGNNVNLYETLSRNDVKLIILNFWATYCPICLKEIPNFISLYNDYKDKGVIVIGINTDTSSLEKMRTDVIDKYGINYPILLDTNSEVYDSYSVSGVPNLFVVDKNREIILHHLGSTESYFDYLRSYLDKYLA